MPIRLHKIFDAAAFYVTVAAGITGAVASAYGEALIAGLACGVAATVPIANRLMNGRFLGQLGPRTLSPKQRKILIDRLHSGPGFKLWLCHNRHEAEPAAYHRQINAALLAAGLETDYYGGMTNSTRGIEISGKPTIEKKRIMDAFKAAKIPFVAVEFSDAPDPEQGFGRLGVWIGVNPGISL